MSQHSTSSRLHNSSVGGYGVSQMGSQSVSQLVSQSVGRLVSQNQLVRKQSVRKEEKSVFR